MFTQSSESMVQGSGLKLQGLSSMVQGSRSFNIQSMFSVDSSGVNAEASKFRVDGSGVNVEGSRFKVNGAGVMIEICVDMVMCNNK